MRCDRAAGLWLLLAACLAAQGCSSATAEPELERPPKVVASADELSLAQAANREFAIELYQQLAQERPGENLFFSPFSISSALLIASEGASGETAEQMNKVLCVPAGQLAAIHKGQAAIYYRLSPEPTSPQVREKMAQLRRDLDAANAKTKSLEQASKWDEAQQSADTATKLADELNALIKVNEPYEWRAANALWGEQTYPFRPTYLDTIRANYGGVVFPVDFRKNSDAARKQINAWVEKQTRDRIKDLLARGTLDKDTRLVITNAVYFKGEWLQPFEQSATKPQEFHLADGKRISTPMMHQYTYAPSGYAAFQGDGKPFETPHEIPFEMKDDDPSLYPDAAGFTMLELPYKGGKLAMAMIVPRSADGLADLERKLTSGAIQNWIGGLERRTVIAYVPKFKLEAEYALEKSLQSLGMSRAFKEPGDPDGAQLDRMTENKDPKDQLFISAVRHKTFVEVNEKGTEAAAATAVMMDAAKIRAEPPKTRPFIPTFSADKPFLFAIYDHETHSLLFLGRMVKPQ